MPSRRDPIAAAHQRNRELLNQLHVARTEHLPLREELARAQAKIDDLERTVERQRRLHAAATALIDAIAEYASAKRACGMP